MEFAMVLDDQGWEDIAAVCDHFLMVTRWVEDRDHQHHKAGGLSNAEHEEHVKKLKRQRAICARIKEAS